MAEECRDGNGVNFSSATEYSLKTDVQSQTAASASNDGFDPAMHNAARSGDVHIIEALYSADRSAVNSVDKLQRTPLHLACWAGFVGAAEKLIQLGADVDAPAIDAMTPLMFASQNNHVSIIQLLARSGAALDAQDTKKKSSALHIAASKSHVDAVNTLLQCGASPSVRNKAGQTPGDCATDSKLKQLLPRSKAAMSRARAERKEAAALAGDSAADVSTPKRERAPPLSSGVKRPAVSFDEE